ncbi:hypothetical protein JCM21900_002269 [Sporobolomyces salmonicolor]
MARFGLVDSDQESTASSHSDNESQSTARRSRRSTSYLDQDSDYALDQEGDDQDGEDNDFEEPPPRSSLMQDDLMEEDSEDDDDEVASSLAGSRTRRSFSALSRSARSTRSISAHSHTTDLDPSSSTHSDAETPSPPRPTRQLAAPQPWASKLKLEPKRVAVMQASFFGRGVSKDREEDEEQREKATRDEERENKRRAVEMGFAGRAAPPTVSVPQPVPAPIVDPTPFRPHRTYTRVPLSMSVTAGKESNLVDAGLALGRSFRVGWGPKGQIVSLKGIYERTGGTRSDIVTVEKLKLLVNDDPAPSLRLLQLQLSQTQIFPSSLTDPTSSSPVPFASPSPSLRFSHFVNLFTSPSQNPSSSAALPAPDPNSPEAQLFKLASCLFDEIPDLALPTEGQSDELEYLTPSYGAYVEALRRRDRLSAWLEEAVRAEVDEDLRSSSGAERIFAHLTGHQISLACDAALSTSYLRLATLLSQAGSSSTDPSFQADLFLQLQKWREYRVDSEIPLAVRKIYELLCGNLGVSEGRKGSKEDGCEETHVLQGLGWKRAVGMGIWYGLDGGSGKEGAGGDAGVGEAIRRYEAAFTSDSRVAPPTPSYLLHPSPSFSKEVTWATSASEAPQDPAYHLLKLFTSPTHPLESALSPRNFGASPTDYRLPWHLYMLFSRVLRRRDFEDRVELDGMGEGLEKGREGNSTRADAVTVAYAAQLEAQGKWEWACFVLLHLELESCRAKAIQSLLTRNIASLTPSLTTFLLSTLHLPPTWLFSARATHSLAFGTPFESYKLLLSAQRPEEAHRIAVEELVPEAVARGDAKLVRRLLEPFLEGDEEEWTERRGTVEGWEEGGKIYLLYLSILSTFSSPSHLSSASSALLARTIAAVQAFSTRINATARTKGNVKLRLAVGEMASRLTVLSKAMGGKPLQTTQPSTLQEADRLVWLQGATKGFLENSLAKATAGKA